MTHRRSWVSAMTALGAVAVGVLLSTCSGPSAGGRSATPVPSSDAWHPEPQADATASDESIAGTIVHFTTGNVLVEVVIEEDKPTTRSFLEMLPMTLTFSDYGGKEKVATPTGEWDFTDAEGLDPAVGDLFSYMPWGNLGFFYDADGTTFSNDLTKVGETDDIDQITLLDGEEVTIAVAD